MFILLSIFSLQFSLLYSEYQQKQRCWVVKYYDWFLVLIIFGHVNVLSACDWQFAKGSKIYSFHPDPIVISDPGESAPPSKLVLDRQRLVMEQLRDRLNLNVEDIAVLSEDQLRATVDSAVGQIVNPLKMKSQLVSQLQTQITDLEMFIQFLQEVMEYF